MTALREDVALPYGVLGPVLNWALARLARIWDSEVAVKSTVRGISTGVATEAEATVTVLALAASFRAWRSAARRMVRADILD